jgi:hypothetical protein
MFVVLIVNLKGIYFYLAVDFGGSQEEHVATCGNSTALLGCCGSIIEVGVKNYVRGNYPLYDDGYHIPPVSLNVVSKHSSGWQLLL